MANPHKKAGLFVPALLFPFHLSLFLTYVHRHAQKSGNRLVDYRFVMFVKPLILIADTYSMYLLPDHIVQLE